MSNSTFTQTIQVNKNQTAAVYGSGVLPVFATPALIALMENTAMQLIELPESNSSSVGISINMKHLKASAIGEIIHCTAIVTEINGKKYSFHIKALDEAGNLIGECEHERVVVNVEKFMSKLKSQS